MAKGLIEQATLTAIADAIRAKTETTAGILPADMAGLIDGLSSECEIITGTFSPAASGEYTADLGVILPDSDNFLFVCGATAMSTSSGERYTIGNVVVKAQGETSGRTWGTPFTSETTLSIHEVGSLDTSGDTTALTSQFQFKKNETYEWWYMYG